MTDRNRPWPGPGYKAIFRIIYLALIVWDLFPPTWWPAYLGAALTFGVWMFLEWVWLVNYRRWLESRAATDFAERAEAGTVFTVCPKCGEQDIPVREFYDHLRLMHPDIELEGLRPQIHLEVRQPPLWVRLW